MNNNFFNLTTIVVVKTLFNLIDLDMYIFFLLRIY